MEAVPLLREAMEGHCEVLGNRHPSTLSTINNLTQLLLTASGARQLVAPRSSFAVVVLSLA